jgi:hypothetical protein
MLNNVTSSASGALELPHLLQGQSPSIEEANGGTRTIPNHPW